MSYYIDQFWDDIANPTLNHIFPGGPWILLSLVAVYLALVLQIGPSYMNNRKPYQLTEAIKYYNIINIVCNAFITVVCLYWTRFTIDCWNCGHILTPFEIRLGSLLAPCLLSMKVSLQLVSKGTNYHVT